MSARALLVASGLLVASLVSASADSVTATISHWDAQNRVLTMSDQSQFVDIPKTIAIPGGLKAGDRVSVEFEGSENGVDTILGVTSVPQ